MKKFWILSALLLAAASAAQAKKELPSVYMDMSYNYAAHPQKTDENSFSRFHFVYKPALLLNHEGFVLAKTKDYEDLLNSYAQRKTDADENRITSVSPKIALMLPNELHDHYFMNNEVCKDIGEGFCIFKAALKPDTSENAKALNYPKIFENKKDASVFKDAFNYKPKDDKMSALKSGVDGYFNETPAASAPPAAQNIAAKVNERNTPENTAAVRAGVENTAAAAGVKNK